MILGTAQDAGYPQVDCQRACCEKARKHPAKQRDPVSLALFSPEEKMTWLIECTPAFPHQWQKAHELLPEHELAGICLTHAHIGHYTGLMYLGREVMGTERVPVYAMPRMDTFLRSNGPWSQLVELENIWIRRIQEDVPFDLGIHFTITPLKVPHRDEYSETVGYVIQGPEKSLLFLPDIDKWHLWEQDIRQWVRRVDYALLDATFYDETELPGRDMSEVPHPFVRESTDLFAGLPDSVRSRIHFIHLNHTNPLLDVNSPASQSVKKAGFRIAQQGALLNM